jgi:hypothetical protein
MNSDHLLADHPSIHDKHHCYSFSALAERTSQTLVSLSLLSEPSQKFPLEAVPFVDDEASSAAVSSYTEINHFFSLKYWVIDT